MYFQELADLEAYGGEFATYSNYLKELDRWLASRHIRTYNYLTPLAFSRFSGLDLTISTELFIICTLDDISLLKERYDISDPTNELSLGSFASLDEIPESITHPETGQSIKINEDLVSVYFELLNEPTSKPSIIAESSSGKSQGITLIEYKDIKESFSMSRTYRKYND